MKIWAAAVSMALFVPNIQSIGTEIPDCAVKCIGESVMLPMTTSNFTSLCADMEETSSLELCINHNCSITEALVIKNMTETVCGKPRRDRSNAVSITGIVGISLAMITFLLRVLARTVHHQSGIDDWTMIMAMGFVLPLSALSVVLANHGLGKDIWTLPSDEITYILYIYYIDESLYIGSLTMIKVSILFFYLRIFPKKVFRRVVYTVMTGNILYGIIFILLSIFQCIPVKAAWTRWQGEVPARCLDINALGWASAGINIFFDVIILILPLPELTKLVMSYQRKIHILLMFGLGSFVTIVSILRLSSLIKFANTQDITWDYVPIGYWSTVEVHVSVVCACLPALPSLFRKRHSSAATEATPLPHRSTRAGSEVRYRYSNGSPSVKVVNIRQRDSELSPSRQIRVSSCVTVTNTPRGNNEFTFNGMPSSYSTAEGTSAKR